MKAGWELELRVVIGRRTFYVADDTEAAAAIAGYVLVNEVSEREWQVERGHQSVKGKSAPTVNSAGPWLASPDEIDEVLDPEMLIDVDAKRYQTGSRSTMLFGPTSLGHHLGQFIALELGDLVNTGTPLGVGMGQKPPTHLRGGKTMELSVSRLGRRTQAVASHLQAGQ
jgi:2,4-diketo-3-deoxy-L-fuconate hydrolase